MATRREPMRGEVATNEMAVGTTKRRTRRVIPTAPPRVHLIQPTGYGGIFQHTVALAALLADRGVPVTIHTAADHEPAKPGGVDFCECVRWRRGESHEAHARLRRARVAFDYLARSLPHLVRAVRRREVAHLEGAVRLPMTVITLLALRLRGVRVVQSPHNTFSRRDWAGDDMLLRLSARIAHCNVAFSSYDEERLRSWGGRVVRSPLVQVVESPREEAIRNWRRRWRAGERERVILFAGQVRRDKRLDALVESAVGWPEGRRLAVVGEDRGDWARCRQRAAELGVPISATIGFVPLDEFLAAIAAADVVVAPYERGSQSGVLAVARELGVPSVATRVGGLGELAQVTVPPGDTDALGDGIEAALAARLPAGHPSGAEEAVAEHLEAYRRPARPDLRRWLRRPRVCFIAWTSVEGRPLEIAAALGGEACVTFPRYFGHSWLAPVRYMFALPRTTANLAIRRPRALIATTPPVFPALLALAYARIAGVPLILDSHPRAFGRKSPRRWTTLPAAHRRLVRRADATLVASDVLAREVRAWGGRPLLLHEAPPLWTTAPPREPGPRPTLLWTGIFAPDEPLGELFGAARALPGVDFVVPGDLRRCRPDLLLRAPTNVRFTGFLRGEDYHRALEAADVVLTPTTDDASVTRGAYEAVYARRPLIVSDTPVLRHYFPHAVATANDAAAYATAIRDALARHADLRSSAEVARADQLRRWEEQRAALARILAADGSPLTAPAEAARSGTASR